MPALKTIWDEDRQFRFEFPDPPPSGQSVVIDRVEHEGTHRVHVYTPDRFELYFEVIAYPDFRDHAQLYQQQKEGLVAGFEDANVGSLQRANFGSFEAHDFVFSGGTITRRFLFVDSPQRSYRIVYNPLSPLNEEILATLEIGAS